MLKIFFYVSSDFGIYDGFLFPGSGLQIFVVGNFAGNGSSLAPIGAFPETCSSTVKYRSLPDRLRCIKQPSDVFIHHYMEEGQ